MVRVSIETPVWVAVTAAIFVLPALDHELGAEEVETPPAVELDPQVDLFVDMIYHSATRHPIEVRRASGSDPRFQSTFEKLDRELRQARDRLIREARSQDQTAVRNTGASAAEKEDAAELSRKRRKAIRRLAVFAGRSDDARAREVVIELLADEDQDVRNTAAIGILQFEDKAQPAIEKLTVLLEKYGTFQSALLALTRVDPRGSKSYPAILEMIEKQSRFGPAPWINALARFEWDGKTPASQRREVLQFLDRLASRKNASGSKTAAKVAREIRAQLESAEE